MRAHWRKSGLTFQHVTFYTVFLFVFVSYTFVTVRCYFLLPLPCTYTMEMYFRLLGDGGGEEASGESRCIAP
jgi:hypothetical protein